MIFWASTEAHEPAYEAVRMCRLSVEPFLNTAFAASGLASVEAKLRYIPIVMPAGMRERYPARSRLRRKERIYDCAPQLDYEVFVSGSLEQQLKAYIDGIASSAPHLSEFGATNEQIAEFKNILARAVERILVERPDQTRH
jgi:hypothetical protein